MFYFVSFPILKLIAHLYQYDEAFASPQKRDDHPILIHAASVGEVNAVAALLNQLDKDGYPLYLNTVTITGKAIAKKEFPNLEVRLAPIDVWHLRKQQMRLLQPRLILVVETEIWPNMLYAASRYRIPVLFINARISQRSLGRYKKLSGFIALVGSSIRGVLAQSKEDQERFQQLFKVPVKTAGNLKFCLDLKHYDLNQTRAEFGFSPQDFILCWGSSRPGEEELMLSIYPFLKQKIKDFKLILAPRHPKRCMDLKKVLSAYKYSMLSDLGANPDHDVLIIDSLGHLTAAYAISDLVVVGGSFFDFGGHNPLEPAFYAKAIIMGEYYSSCKESVLQLKSRDAIKLSNPRLLKEDILSLAQNPLQIKEMGKRAKLVLTDNSSALNDHIRGIKSCL